MTRSGDLIVGDRTEPVPRPHAPSPSPATTPRPPDGPLPQSASVRRRSMADPFSDLPALDAAEYAALVRNASDDELAAGLRENRALVLDRVFAGMAEHLDPDTARDAEAVVEWHITGREDGGYDQFQMVIRRGTCLTARDGDAEPDVTYTVDGVDFLRLVSDTLAGPELYMTGRLMIEGDLMLGAMTQTWFRTPGSPASTGA